MIDFPNNRGRRLRRTPALRRTFAETRLEPAQMVLPLFVTAGSAEPITSMPGHSRLPVERAVEVATEAAALGVGGVILFGIPVEKDAKGTGAWDPEGPVPLAISTIKAQVPELVVWADVCLCEYTDHGHCGILNGDEIDNDGSLPLLAEAALAYAEAGADIVAPSDMMDGRVGAIRSRLDLAAFENTAICSYAVKYSSAFYGPFREAAGSTPALGDRKSYQMDPPNVREALIEVRQDIAEGADIVMVKPAGPYLDVVAAVRRKVEVPVAAYQVSGEYSMIMAASAAGWVDREAAMMESLIGIARAGAGTIVTYFALGAARLLNER